MQNFSIDIYAIWGSVCDVLGWIFHQMASILYFNSEKTLTCLGVLAAVVSIYKIIWPELRFEIVSFYPTFAADRSIGCVLKLKTLSNVTLIIEKMAIKVELESGDIYEMTPCAFRWKGFLPVMRNAFGRECSYKLIKPLDPDLLRSDIKAGANECYIGLKSKGPVDDKRIKLWRFNIKWKQHMLPIPNLAWFNKKDLVIEHPNDKGLYFDDSLFEKISAEDKTKLIQEL